MKKLTPERQATVLAAIITGKKAFDEYAARKLNTFTDEGRQVITVYWNAQATITDILGTSMTRTERLIQGTATLSDYYDENGKPLKASTN